MRIALLSLAVALAACGAGDTREIAGAHLAKRDPHIPGTAPTAAQRFGFRMPAGHGSGGGAPAAPSSGLRWTLPEGWKSLPATQFRQGNFRAGENGEVECTLSVLPGMAGGVSANVKRWRKQMGLAALSDAELAALPKTKLLGKPAIAVSFDGSYSGMGAEATEGYRLLGAVLEDGGRSIFVKMVGPRESVEKERARFDAFCASLRAGAATPANPHAGTNPRAGMGDIPAAPSFTAPAGWTKKPDRRMRVVTFAPAGDERAECYVSVLPGRAGGEAANINRWRNQMGLPPLSAAEIGALPEVEVLGKGVPLVEASGTFQNMAGETSEGAALLGVVREGMGRSLFVKMTGPKSVVLAEKDNFIRFCESIR